MERDGSTEFYFDKPGDWILEFNGVRKIVHVRELDAEIPALNDLRNNAGITGSNGASGATGLFFWGVAPEWIAVALLLLALAGVAYHKFYFSVPRLRKKIDGKRVRLEISSGGRSLEDVVLTDYAPDEASVSAFTEKASVSETVTGKVLKWKRDLLRSGEIWWIEYELNDSSGTRVKRAEAVASAGGKRVSLFS